MGIFYVEIIILINCPRKYETTATLNPYRLIFITIIIGLTCKVLISFSPSGNPTEDTVPFNLYRNSISCDNYDHLNIKENLPKNIQVGEDRARFQDVMGRPMNPSGAGVPVLFGICLCPIPSLVRPSLPQSACAQLSSLLMLVGHHGLLDWWMLRLTKPLVLHKTKLKSWKVNSSAVRTPGMCVFCLMVQHLTQSLSQRCFSINRTDWLIEWKNNKWL